MQDNQLGRDMLSDLPLGIIETILGLLPIQEAIKTSLLSSKWRFRWTRLPELDFTMDDRRLYQNFITSTLLLHQGPIHKFTVYLYGISDPSSFYPWIRFLSRKDITDLSLRTDNGYFHVPPCVYSFRNLAFLELSGCELGPLPPTFKGFLFLRTLNLLFVGAPSGTIESIISNSPLLEKLFLRFAGRHELRISAPNLKYFSVWDTSEEIYLCAPLLVEMDVMMVTLLSEEFRKKHTDCNYTKFLGGVTNLESLTGDEGFTEYLSIGIQYRRRPLVFNNLKNITLRGVNFEVNNQILVVTRLIMDAANLHELQLNCDSNVEGFQPADFHFLDLECPQNYTFKKLKTIKIDHFHCAFNEMKYIKFLLDRSPVLERMIVEPSHYTTRQAILRSRNELLSYSWPSAKARTWYEEKSKDVPHYCK